MSISARREMLLPFPRLHAARAGLVLVPYARDMLSVQEFGALVEMKLCEHAGDRRPWPEGRFFHLEEGELSFDEYRELVAEVVEHRRAPERREPRCSWDVLIELTCHLGWIWDDGTVERGGEEHERKLAAGTRIALQRYREHHITSEIWRREIAALGRSDAWLALGAEHEAAGRQIQASAALAAAHWLDPATAGAAARVVQARDVAAWPERLLEQPRPGFRDQGVDRRHWFAWDMKHSGRLDVPSMIAYSCDENFWVRGALYRSLGLQPMLAVVPVLLEGLLDPDNFARERAAESLGWTAAPGAFEPLQRMAREDASPQVRWTAELAAQRIAGYWMFYGEWSAVFQRPDGTYAVARKLISRQLGRCARDLVRHQPELESSRAEHDAVVEKLKPFEVPYPLDPNTPPVPRGPAAAEVEAAILRADPVHEHDDMLALYAVSKHRRHAERAMALVSAPGSLGWNARRALRALRLPSRRAP